MARGASRFLMLFIMTLVAGFFILWNLQRRRVSEVMTTNVEKEGREMIPTDASKIVIPVRGMTCGSCEMMVERVLKELDGVYAADASAEKGVVAVHYKESDVSLTRMKRVIDGTGYSAGEEVE